MCPEKAITVKKSLLAKSPTGNGGGSKLLIKVNHILNIGMQKVAYIFMQEISFSIFAEYRIKYLAKNRLLRPE